MSPPQSARALELIATLGLELHPEGGFFVESYRAPVEVSAASHPEARPASTAIYFLVTIDAPSTQLHRLRSDEIFHLYEGGPLEIVRLFADGGADVARLGLDLAAGERPQVAIPSGTWFGTELAPGASHCLVGCTVAPGFSFGDFELLEGLTAHDALQRRFPAMATRIERMGSRQREGGA
jgi:predicted cupin superfamily sugar epimerase